MKKYHFTMMAGKNTRYMILEGSRGCSHRCSFCTQWKHWNGVWRTKSAKQIADEMEYFNERFGGEFLWLTDDNFRYNYRAKDLWRELRQRKFTEDITWSGLFQTIIGLILKAFFLSNTKRSSCFKYLIFPQSLT